MNLTQQENAAFGHLSITDPRDWTDLRTIAENLFADAVHGEYYQVYEDVALGADFYASCESLRGGKQTANFAKGGAVEDRVNQALECGRTLRFIAHDMRLLEKHLRLKLRENIVDRMQRHGRNLQRIAPKYFAPQHVYRIAATMACDLIARRFNHFGPAVQAAAWLSIALDPNSEEIPRIPVIPLPGLSGQRSGVEL